METGARSRTMRIGFVAVVVSSALALSSVGYLVLSNDTSRGGSSDLRPPPSTAAPSPSDPGTPTRKPRATTPGTPTSPGPVSTTLAPRETSTTSPAPTSKPPGSALIRWIRAFAPAGGGDKDPYIDFMRRDCAATLDAARDISIEDGVQTLDEPFRSLYEGAAAACLAGLDGRREYWPLAVELFPDVDPAALSCWEREVHAVYEDLIEAHRRNATILLADQTRGSSECPQLLGLEPDHGPRSGGYPVTVVGRNLPEVLDLFWGDLGVDVQARRGADGTMTVMVPEAEPDVESVLVAIAAAPRLDAPFYAWFHYE